jgi:hypothetical protein
MYTVIFVKLDLILGLYTVIFVKPDLMFVLYFNKVLHRVTGKKIKRGNPPFFIF